MSLLRGLPILLVGWGPILVCLATSVVGLLTESAGMLLVGAAAGAVPSVVIALNPGQAWVLAFPIVLVMGAWLVRRHRRGYAALLVGACVSTATVLFTLVALG